MLKRFTLLLALVFAVPAPALAQNFQDFSQQSFEAALATGRPVVVNFYETWCSRCATQRCNLSALQQQDAYSGIIVLEAIFSEHRNFASSMGINAHTSLALIVNRDLVAIEVGGTSRARVQALLDKAG
jgi:thiol-disulfide isomerase/thioredoxin